MHPPRDEKRPGGSEATEFRGESRPCHIPDGSFIVPHCVLTVFPFPQEVD